jgi:hypothetical protein
VVSQLYWHVGGLVRGCLQAGYSSKVQQQRVCESCMAMCIMMCHCYCNQKLQCHVLWREACSEHPQGSLKPLQVVTLSVDAAG